MGLVGLVSGFFFPLYIAGNIKVLGWLSSFSPQVIQDQKTLRIELHRLKRNQRIKNSKANSKRTVMRKVKLTFAHPIVLFTLSY